MDFDQVYAEYHNKVENRLKDLVVVKEPMMMYEPFHYFMQEGGKRIRPILTMLSAAAVGGDPLSALDCGCAIEIMHNFTLVHDDIMDKSDMRRGKATVHKKWNEPIAILTGDVMIGAAYDIIPNSDRYFEIIKMFTHGLVEVCEGQVYDMQFNDRHDVSLDEYLLMIKKKTAKLLETCAVIGAHCGKANEEQIEALSDYAINLGLAFQIQDDMLDMIADEKKLGKKVGLDIQEGKKTFLIITAAEASVKPEHKELLDKYFKSSGLPFEYVEQFKNMFDELGIFDFAQGEIDRLFAEAENSLSVLPDNDGKEMLKRLIAKLNNRAY